MLQVKSFKSILLEVFSIVLGVLLALAVNEWQQEREKAQLAHAALTNIAKELEANRVVLETVHAINVATIEAASSALSDSDADAAEEDRQFIPGVQVRATAWEAMLSSGASNHIDYELLLTLSQTYSLQSVYRGTGLQLVESSMTMAAMATVSNTEIDELQFQRQFQGFFDMMLQMEEALLAEYASTRELLGQTLGTDGLD